ncbi:MAG: lipopolysaccharide assembly protein LapA domain-containing protein [Actinomycetota bacterium]|nr:lipopolysaccharide assembly protein LapA domain-containing protein [Actinomycetota bacterium]
MADPDRNQPRAHEPGDPEPAGAVKRAQGVTIALLIVGLLTAIFVLQNTNRVRMHFLFWSISTPLAGALLLAVVLGGLLAFLVAFVRQRQFRRAMKREHRLHNDRG